MTREEMTKRLHKETAGVHADPALRARTMCAVRRETTGKDEPIVKKKISLAFVAALVAVMMGAVALAAANRWGLLDFAGRSAVPLYIPEDAQNYVETDVLTMDSEAANIAVRELYYDGRTVRATIDMTPKGERVLLVGLDMDADAPMVKLYAGVGEDMRPLHQAVQEEGYAQVYAADAGFWSDTDMAGGMMDYVLGEDGTLTMFVQQEYTDDLPERDVELRVDFLPFQMPMAAGDGADWEKRIVEVKPVKLTAAKAEMDTTNLPAGAIPGTYVNVEPVAYPSVGVRVDRVLIEEKPHELYATVDFTVTDWEAYEKTDDGLWFEFIDPEKPEKPGDEPWQQRLTDGLSGGGSVGPVEPDEPRPASFRQTGTLGKNELHDSYTLRAFGCWDKERFETHTFEMRPAIQADVLEE